MIAILLAGGKGSRLGNYGRLQPKPLMPVGAEPIVNYMIDKLLALPEEITQIYVLARQKQFIEGKGETEDFTLDLKTAFDNWRRVWYPADKYPQIILKYEEELLPGGAQDQQGAINGLLRFLQWMDSGESDTPRISDDESIFICAADNYIEDDLRSLFAQARAYQKAIINAYVDFHDKEMIRRKYGAIEVNRHGWAVSYVEKPDDPSIDQTRASTAIYVFPFEQFRRICEYAREPIYGMDAPGNLLQWFINKVYPDMDPKSDQEHEKGIGVRGYELCGRWFDIGRKSDLVAAVKWYADWIVTQVETVEDLVLLARSDSLNDKYFLLCYRLEVDANKRLIRLYFQSGDKVCKLSNAIPGNIQTVSAVKNNSSSSGYWTQLKEALVQRSISFDQVDNPFKAPLLVSGGVFLLDSVGARLSPTGTHHLGKERTLIPLLEKDPASPTDPGRMTTPAGRMDILDLYQVCFAELGEEMIFYGANQLSEQIKIYCCAPVEFQNAKRKILDRIHKKRLHIPNIGEELILRQLRLDEKSIDLVEVIPPTDVSLPKEISWRVEIYLDGDCQSTCENVIAIPDQQNGTLEFRIASMANITGVMGSPNSDRYGRRIGKLFGIADGDGYDRRPFVISAAAFQKYYRRVKSLSSRNEIVDYIMNSQQDAAELVAIGEPGTGRFSNFDCKMPILPLTTSVRYLADLLDYLL